MPTKVGIYQGSTAQAGSRQPWLALASVPTKVGSYQSNTAQAR